jgi:membrane-bound lytic murein transglycosylase B
MVLFRRWCGRYLASVLVLLGVHAVFWTAESVASDDPGFAAWVKDLEEDARDAGISEETIREAIGGLKLVPDVVELDRKQGRRPGNVDLLEIRIIVRHRNIEPTA